MSNTAIKVENLGKLYKLGEISTGTISHDLKRWWATARGKEDPFAKIGSVNDRTIKNENDYVWALKDVNFEVKQGEALGIIGRNGAGKSTLLKLLSKVTSPSSGSIKVKGRIASLLEVGTGFHPELTGRENVFLNGAIMGMTKSEIKAKFDEIVDFSGVERYIDTPVKRYSSGMYVRLAFAVAAHLEPEILIVDEVLAVGDAEFQKKCLGKMKDVSAGEGRTVLFVSHHMGSIAQLCNSCLLMKNGTLDSYGQTNLIIDKYINAGRLQTGGIYIATQGKGHKEMYIKSAHILKNNGIEETIFRHDESIHLRINVFTENWINGSELRIIIRDSRDLNVFTNDIDLGELKQSRGDFYANIKIPEWILRPNQYSVFLALFVPHQFHIEIVEEALAFTVYDGGTKYAQSEGTDYGMVFSPCISQLEIGAK